MTREDVPLLDISFYVLKYANTCLLVYTYICIDYME